MARKNASSSSDSNSKVAPTTSGKRVRLSQTEVPGYTLEQALRVPRAIADNFAYKPAKPLLVSQAMGMKPNSGPFRGLCGAAVAYALTSGGSNAPEISIEPLGMRIVRPLEEGDDLFARREALLKPRVVGEFLHKYDGAPLPRTDIAQNVLIDMGVPLEKVGNVLSLILEEAQVLGLIEETDGKKRVYLEGVIPTPTESNEEESDEAGVDASDSEYVGEEPTNTLSRDDFTGNQPIYNGENTTHEASKRRVFITHGNNKTFVDPIKKLLGFGELEAVVSTQRQSVSQPVPDKVMNDMRGCGAAIIHVDAEQKLINQDAEEQIVLNPNVLMEIGAAMALYGRRFILLVKEGVKLPSNLQGLYEVRYVGENLDGDATIRLLEAINDIKNHPLPDRYSDANNSPKPT